MALTLNSLKKGAKAKIIDVCNNNEIGYRLREMGVVPNSEVEVVGKAFLGNPIEISIKGYLLSLRKCEAKCILVEPLKSVLKQT